MAIKKGSAAAKAWGAKMKRLRNARKPKKKKSSSIKRKKPIKSKKTYKVAKKRKTKKRSSKRSSKILGLNVAGLVAPMLYGAVRSRASDKLAPYTARIPMGAISDEVGMYGAAWLLKKYVFKSKGIPRDVLSVGQNIELARIGEAVAQGQVRLGMGAASQNSGYNFA